MNLVLCERFSTKMTAGACDKFRANTPERCAGCNGPVPDAKLAEPLTLATPVHAKPKTAAFVVDYAGQKKKKDKKEEVATVGKDARKTIKKVAACGKCSDVKPIMARGLCGKCWHRERNAGTLEENFPAARGLEKKVMDSDTVKFPAFSSLNKPSSNEYAFTAHIYLSFEGPADRIIFEELTIEAKKNRRTLDQEILFRLERGEVAA